MWRVAVRTDFAAAHLIPGHSKCGRLHGHNYDVEVILESAKLGEMGFVIDFGILKEDIKAIVSRLDHTYLNENLPPEHMPPSAEHIAAFIYGELASKQNLTGMKLAVKVFETQKSWAEYSG